MRNQDSYMYERSSHYSIINPSEKSYSPRISTQESRMSNAPRAASAFPYQTVGDSCTRPDSYIAINNAHTTQPISIPQGDRKVIKWMRAVLLVLRTCAWIGAAGLVACLVLIKPIGTLMDWVVRLTPVAALMHNTYAIYYLCWSVTSRTANYSCSNMIFTASIDLCLIPLQVLIAILTRNQLANPLDEQTIAWQTILAEDSQQHIILMSTYLLGLVDAGLHLVLLCTCVFVAIKNWRLAHSTSDTNRSEANLTARRHQKSNNSVSTFMSEASQRDSNVSLLNNSTNQVSTFRVLDRKIERQTERPGPQMNRGHVYRQSTHPVAPVAQGLRSPQFPRLSSQTTPIFKPNKIEQPTIAEDVETWGTHPPTPPPASPPQAPPELQQLRVQNPQPENISAEPLLAKAKYDFSNRSPKPLGLHPPTPRVSTPSSTKGFDVRALRNIDGNSSAKKKSKPVWHEVDLGGESVAEAKEELGAENHDDDIVSIGSVTRSQARVVSSGTDKRLSDVEVKLRKVSAKSGEEGKKDLSYTDF